MAGKEKDSSHAGYTMTWSGVNLDITSGKILGLFGEGKSIRTLSNASGYLTPGQSLAIIGPSGAGKTTLLDILAQQKSLGKVTGEILVNGKAPDAFFGKRAGYIFSGMAHIPTMTVYETIIFAAHCRMPRESTEQEIHERVEEVIRNLRLTNARDTFVGDELIRGISSGEKKRTEVGIEMVARPKALFFDEPTSGLDDYGARFTMELVLDYIRHENVTVMVVIHQPCEAVFKLFDNVCLVGDRGRITYFGPVSKCEEHFASFGYPTPPLTNPIEHYLDVMAIDTAKCHEFYEKSPLYAENMREIARLNGEQYEEVPHSPNLVEPIWTKQFRLIWDRCWLRYWRNPSTSWGRASMFMIFAVMFGLFFLKLTDDGYGMRTRLGVSVTYCYFPIFVAIAAVPQFMEDRELYIQEFNSAFYYLWPFWLTYVVIEVIYCILIVTIEYTIVYFMSAAFKPSNFGIGYAMMVMQCLLAVVITFTWSSWSKTIFQAYTALWGAGVVFWAFSGGQAPLAALRPWIRWMADVNYWRWAQQFIDYHLLADFTFSCPQLNSSLFAPGAVSAQAKTYAGSFSANSSDDATNTAAYQVLQSINALQSLASRTGAPASLVSGISALTTTLSASKALNASASLATELTQAKNYGSLDYADQLFDQDQSFFINGNLCVTGDLSTSAQGWLLAYIGIGSNEPAITGWAFFANGMLFLFFLTMSYLGLIFSRNYRKR